MQIKLGSSTFMWGLAGKCHLTGDDPGPIEVDFDSLSKEDKKTLILGLRSGKIASSENTQELASKWNAQYAIKKDGPSVIGTSTKQVPHIEPNRDEDFARPLLNQSFNTIKKEVGTIDEVRKLRVMLELEKTGKNRKSVIELLEVKLKLVGAAITDNIIVQTSNIAPESAEGLDKLASAIQVVDLEEKTTTVKL